MAREHARAFADVHGVRLSGITSRTKARAEALAAGFGIPHVAGGIPELWDHTHAQLVIVAVPEPEVLKVCQRCLEYGWTLLVEKPPGLDAEEARQLAANAAASGSRVLVALNRRHYSSTLSVLEGLSHVSGPRIVQVHDQQDLREAQQYAFPPETLANWHFANCIHLVDYLRIFCRGDVVRVATAAAGREVRRLRTAQVQFESGDVGLYVGIWNAPGPWSVTVTTTARRWEIRPLETAVFQNRGERRLQPIERLSWDEQFKPGLRRQAEQVVRILSGGEGVAPTIADALRTVELVERIYRDPADCQLLTEESVPCGPESRVIQ
jgi:predicted dehydrogenase